MNRIQTAFNSASTFHVGDNAYTVELGLDGGRRAYHVGPGKYPYFTKDEAEALAQKVSMAGSINPEFWTDEYCRPLLDTYTPRERRAIQL